MGRRAIQAARRAGRPAKRAGSARFPQATRARSGAPAPSITRAPPAAPAPPTPDGAAGAGGGGRCKRSFGALREPQGLVLILREVEGCSTEEVCNALGFQETNARVLLHRARAKVRAAFEPYLKGV